MQGEDDKPGKQAPVDGRGAQRAQGSVPMVLKISKADSPRAEVVCLGYEAAITHSHAVEYLRALLDGLEAGRLTFVHGEDALALSPAGTVRLAISARRSKKGREKVALELRWRTGKTPRLQIVSGGVSEIS